MDNNLVHSCNRWSLQRLVEYCLKTGWRRMRTDLFRGNGTDLSVIRGKIRKQELIYSLDTGPDPNVIQGRTVLEIICFLTKSFNQNSLQFLLETTK